MLVLFNHSLTKAQQDDAKTSLGVSNFIYPPPELGECWSNIPPEAESLREVLAPFRRWLMHAGHPGDFLLVQGDFGATCLMVQHAFSLGLRPLYSTTRREATEAVHGDKVHLSHHFQHIRFRFFEVLST